MKKNKQWFGIRSVYYFGENTAGINVFEERVVVFSAGSFDEAHQKAKFEAEDYADENEVSIHLEQVGYRQEECISLVDGYEVWSQMFEADMSFDDFYKERYEKYTYHPEPIQQVNNLTH